jgi:hypothetical protein
MAQKQHFAAFFAENNSQVRVLEPFQFVTNSVQTMACMDTPGSVKSLENLLNSIPP